MRNLYSAKEQNRLGMCSRCHGTGVLSDSIPSDLTLQTNLVVLEPDAESRETIHEVCRDFGLHVLDFRSIRHFVTEYKQSAPTCVLLDMSLPQVELRRFYMTATEAESGMSFIVISEKDDSRLAVDAMRRGASDFILRPIRPDRLREALHEAVDAAVRRWHLCQQVASFRERLEVLSPRESEVAQLVCEGCLNKEIAQQLGISNKTVEGHRDQIRKKLRCNSVPELVRLMQFHKAAS